MFRVFRRNLSTRISKEKNHFLIDGNQKVSFAWLRDHCKSEALYDSRNHQKKFEFPEVTKVENFKEENSSLWIQWKDGIESKFCLKELEKWLGGQQDEELRQKLWTALEFPSNTFVTFDSFMNTKEGLKKALKYIWTNGFCVVSEAPKSTEFGTKVVAERIGPIFRSTYGDLWELSTKQAANVSDTSYSNGRLEPHTDATYLNPASGIQLFHCLKVAEEGGDTILVDGFQLAKGFKEECPEGFDFLATHPIEAQYLHTEAEPHAHYTNKDVIFKMYPNSQQLLQVRINAYDRGPHQFKDLKTQLDFYKYFQHLITMTKAEKYAKYISLTPGNVLLVNNWRLLHGRTAFKGERTLSGCYVGYNDFLSNCRTCGLTIPDPF